MFLCHYALITLCCLLRNVVLKKLDEDCMNTYLELQDKGGEVIIEAAFDKSAEWKAAGSLENWKNKNAKVPDQPPMVELSSEVFYVVKDKQPSKGKNKVGKFSFLKVLPEDNVELIKQTNGSFYGIMGNELQIDMTQHYYTTKRGIRYFELKNITFTHLSCNYTEEYGNCVQRDSTSIFNVNTTGVMSHLTDYQHCTLLVFGSNEAANEAAEQRLDTIIIIWSIVITYFCFNLHQ